MYAGEYLLNSQIETLSSAFNIKHIYSVYGSAETGIWGWTLYSEHASSFEILDDIIVEIENPDENGNGLIVVTNLLRKRFPLMRYSMGDIGRVEYKDDKRFLVLKSRVPISFALNSYNFYLHDFDWILEFTDRFQIQIIPKSVGKFEAKFLLIKSNKNSDSMIEEVVEKLERILIEALPITALVVELVSESDLYSDPTTSKTPAIKDFRN